MIHRLALLQEVDDEQAWDLLIRILHDTPSTLRSGASWAVAAKLTNGEVSDSELRAVESIAAQMLQRSRSVLQRLDALTMMRALPDASRERLDLQRIDEDALGSLRLAQRNAELCSGYRARSVSAKVAETAQSTTAIEYAVGPDQHVAPSGARSALPRRPRPAPPGLPVAGGQPLRAQLGGPLVELAGGPDEDTSVLATEALFQIGDHRQRGVLLEASLSDERAPVRSASLLTLGQVVGQVTEVEAQRLCSELSHGSVTECGGGHPARARHGLRGLSPASSLTTAPALIRHGGGSRARRS